ncbi:TIGR02281 family clan AA aspartic protease [uncultured Sphingomonas sp.]|uniref:retropepsin-like aspartic protease family protein n=1 Tax=uncultured Sphingomonas sp. TaxID=158754 RepID=UPI0035CAC4AC
MTDRTVDLVIYGLLLLLPLSALFARRPSLGRTLRSLVGWVAIFGVGLAAVQYRDRLPDIGRLLDDQKVVGRETRIRMSPDGHFWARVTINGVGRRMLVDSGATLTAISEETARDAGIDAGEGGLPIVLRTANGTVAARRGTADQVQVGSVRTEHLRVVVSSAFGDVDVIGMNFLSRLASWRVEGRTLIMTPTNAA